MKVLSGLLLFGLMSFFKAEGQEKGPALIVLGN
jgi:hypothetical protein